MARVALTRLLTCAATSAAVVVGVLVAAPVAAAAIPTPTLVAADAETVPTTHAGDSADDPALWVHPTDPASSLLIGNDKLGALEVYNLDGSLRQRITTATTFWGNVDVRQGVTFGTRTLDVVAVYNGGGLRIYGMDLATRMLEPITEGGGPLPASGEGLCLYDNAETGRLSVVLITRPGQLRQFLLADPDGDGLLSMTLAREFAVGSEAEGCVADDISGRLYVDQEDVGLWRYGAEPDDGSARSLVDAVQPDGHLAADAEGVTLVDLGGGAGYVIASAQNTDDPSRSYFTVYDRQSNAYVGAFRIVDGTGADGCSRTDGVTAYAGDLGAAYPSGMFVCQDDDNRAPGTSGNQNFKLTRLEKVIDLDGVGGNTSPTASFTASCDELTCSFDGRASSDTEGPIASYSWDFGDGTVAAGATTSHTYAGAGQRTVVLTVRDGDDALGTTSRVVNPTSTSTSALSFVAAASANGNRLTHAVPVPAAVRPGDTLLLFFVGNSSTRTITGPSGWSQVQAVNEDGIVGRLWTRQATAADAGTTVRVVASGMIKADLTVAAYRGAGSPPIAESAVRADTATADEHTTPQVAIPASGGWLLSYWGTKSSATTALDTPAGQIVRSDSTADGGGHVTAALTDGGGPVGGGTGGGLTATSDALDSRAAMFSVVLSGGSGGTNGIPTASFTVSCVELECSLDGTGSTDDGGVASYAWNFGDGETGSGPSTAHTYATPGTYTVTLTVTDAAGAADSTTRTAQATSPATEVSFVAAASANGNLLTHRVVVPSAVEQGDVLLLFFAGNVTAGVTGPGGWTAAESVDTDGVVAGLWWKVAGPNDAGSQVVVRTSRYVKADLSVAAYRGTSATPLAVSDVAVDGDGGAAHTTPTVAVAESGGWLVSYWATKSSGASGWTPPPGQSVRTGSTGSGGGHMTAVLTDGGGPVAPGTRGGLTATADAAGSATLAFSAVVRLAG